MSENFINLKKIVIYTSRSSNMINTKISAHTHIAIKWSKTENRESLKKKEGSDSSSHTYK